MQKLSPRLEAVLLALPLKKGMRVLEIGCGPGALARAIAEVVGAKGFVLAIDRSESAIQAAKRSSIEFKDRLIIRKANAETFELEPGERRFDLVVAIRVGAFDGRHPKAGELALKQVAKALKPGGKFFIDAGKTIKELKL